MPYLDKNRPHSRVQGPGRQRLDVGRVTIKKSYSSELISGQASARQDRSDYCYRSDDECDVCEGHVCA